MVEVVVFAEGQTEEKFIKQVVAPSVRHLEVFVKPQMLNTSKTSKGGAISLDRLKFNARNTLRQNSHLVLSTFLDLYALDTDFPAFEEAKNMVNVYKRVKCLETALHNEITSYVGCRSDRFLPYIQPYEYEGLLFSDVEILSTIEPNWSVSLLSLKEVIASVESPEHINDGYDTKPSKRLENLLSPKYKKTTHGPRAAERITLSVIERECSHFKTWMDSLRSLSSL
ncbi:MAG: DUF4276 family protein [Deltaproteobacteria bacterium]|nr:DUF4276 family protein [Deltaproteobacteria bacterium]